MTVTETGATCPRCGDLNDWAATECASCDALLGTTHANITPAYGMRPVGGFGIRGWRAHCAHCGHLGRVRTNYGTCARDVNQHRCAA